MLVCQILISYLDPLEQRLQEVMVGQVHPIEAVSAAIRRRQNGWQDDDKPIVMLFLVKKFT